MDSSLCWIKELFLSPMLWNGGSLALEDWKGSVTLEYWQDRSLSSTWRLSSIFFKDLSSYLSLKEDFLLLFEETASDFLLLLSSASSWDWSFLILLALDDLGAIYSCECSIFELCLLLVSSFWTFWTEGCREDRLLLIYSSWTEGWREECLLLAYSLTEGRWEDFWLFSS